MTFPHIADSEHQTELAISLTDNSVPREQQRLSSLLGPAHLCEHYAHHERLDHHTDDALDAHNEDRLRTFLGRDTTSVTDRVLRLDTEQETAREREDIVDAGCPVVIYLIRGQMVLFKVTVAERDEPPDDRET